MSDAAEPQTSSQAPSGYIVRDIFLWKRKKQSLLVLSIATVVYVVMEVYQFNFITIASWLAMFILASLFLWGNILRLLGKEAPDMPRFVINEETAMEAVNSIRGIVEQLLRWMFVIGAEKEWFVFAGAIAVLWFISFVGSMFDLVTFLFIGALVCMTIPVTYVKHQDKIKRSWKGMVEKSRRLYDTVEEKVTKILHKNIGEARKEKKVE